MDLLGKGAGGLWAGIGTLPLGAIFTQRIPGKGPRAPVRQESMNFSPVFCKSFFDFMLILLMEL